MCAAILGLPFLKAAAQISPGPLSRAHQELNGPTECMRCHELRASQPMFLCLDCHEEIRVRLLNRRGLHPNIMDPQLRIRGCERCHSEHNGANFLLVKFDLQTFDHAKTGFRLEGKHATLKCAQCHNAQKIQPSERAQIKMKDLNRTFLGLGTACTSCHEDKHRGQLGNKCSNCHTQDDWKLGRSFDHARTRFPLKGAHLQLTCEKCHARGSDGVLRYVAMRFARCADCHRDPHGAAFAERTCESCHSVNGWKQGLLLTSFDHSKTKYPLRGKHLEVGCQKCHRGSNFARPMAFQLCTDCHSDAHNGQFVKRADGGRCESCHTLNGFKQVKFTVKEHSASQFPLRGKHATADCAKCHKPAGKATVFKIKAFALCLDCHKDVHGGQFASATYRNRCEQCHNESGFHPSTFTLARHQLTGFKLTGGHLATACVDCHRPAEKPRAVAYHFERTDCTSCHQDPHRNQFAARMARLTSQRRAAGCEACHVTTRWSDVSRFDHVATEFDLTGAHKAVECAACHRPPNLERTLRNVDFKAAPTQCESCHEDAHAAQFARGGITRCAGCHTTTKWKPSLFDHEKTKFSLAGGHRDVQCNTCHVTVREVSEKRVRFYSPTPTACASCHATRLARGD